MPINICQCIGDVWSRANQGRGTLGELVEQRHPWVHIVTIHVVCITFDARKLLLIAAVHLIMDTSWLKLIWVTFNAKLLRWSQIYWESFHCYDPSRDITFTWAALWNYTFRSCQYEQFHPHEALQMCLLTFAHGKLLHQCMDMSGANQATCGMV